MTRVSLTLVMICGIFGAGIAFAAEDPIKERRAIMKSNGDAVKGVSAMLKGEKPYDAKEVETAMKSINGSITKFVTLFPKGSETGGETAAKPEIWNNKDEFETTAKQLDGATVKAAPAAPNGLDGFRPRWAMSAKIAKPAMRNSASTRNRCGSPSGSFSPVWVIC